MGRGTANIGQDHFRRVVLREHDVPGGDNIQLIAPAARPCHKICGYCVIFTGFGSPSTTATCFARFSTNPLAPGHLDVPLEESLADMNADCSGQRSPRRRFEVGTSMQIIWE